MTVTDSRLADVRVGPKAKNIQVLNIKLSRICSWGNVKLEAEASIASIKEFALCLCDGKQFAVYPVNSDSGITVIVADSHEISLNYHNKYDSIEPLVKFVEKAVEARSESATQRASFLAKMY